MRMSQLVWCGMLSLTEVNRIVDLAASAVLTPDRLSRVFSEYTTDSDGRDALLLTIVLRTDKAKEVTGDTAVDTIVRIHNDLESSGEERMAITEFATEAELEDELEADGEVSFSQSEQIWVARIDWNALRPVGSGLATQPA